MSCRRCKTVQLGLQHNWRLGHRRTVVALFYNDLDRLCYTLTTVDRISHFFLRGKLLQNRLHPRTRDLFAICRRSCWKLSDASCLIFKTTETTEMEQIRWVSGARYDAGLDLSSSLFCILYTAEVSFVICVVVCCIACRWPLWRYVMLYFHSSVIIVTVYVDTGHCILYIFFSTPILLVGSFDL